MRQGNYLKYKYMNKIINDKIITKKTLDNKHGIDKNNQVYELKLGSYLQPDGEYSLAYKWHKINHNAIYLRARVLNELK